MKNSTEIYVIEENRWVMGPAFPRGFLQGGYVNLDDGSFIIAGGYDVDNRFGGHSLHFYLCMLFVKKIREEPLSGRIYCDLSILPATPSPRFRTQFLKSAALFTALFYR